jgi:toxin CcdB
VERLSRGAGFVCRRVFDLASQFDIHRNIGRNREAIPYVLVVQSSLFSRAQRRVVVPLVSVEMLGRVAQLPASSVNPVFDVEGRPVVLNPLEIVSIPLDALGERVGSLAAQGDVVVAALDELFSRAWN